MEHELWDMEHEMFYTVWGMEHGVLNITNRIWSGDTEQGIWMLSWGCLHKAWNLTCGP